MKEIDTSTRSNDTLLEDQKEGAPITDLSITYSTASDLDSDSGFEFVLSAADSRRVQLSKALFVLTLFLAAVGVATWTYIATSSDEHEDFKSLFTDYANEVIKVSQINTENIHNAYKSVAATMTSLAIGANATWPFVTIPLFPSITEHVLVKLKAAYVSVQPLVTESDRKKWEEYSVDNQWWLNESLALQGSNLTSPKIHPYITKFELDGSVAREDNSPDPYYAPVWQVAPASASSHLFTNYNSFQVPDFNYLYQAVREVEAAVISKVQDLSSFTETNRRSWPTSTLAEPVFDTAGQDRKLVALITSLIPWHIYFENILAEGLQPIVAVVENACGQVWSYRIEGPVTVYLGPTDQHDTRYDNLFAKAESTSWQVTEGCDISLSLYPTKEFEQSVVTNEPWFITIAVVGVFITTALAFILYDTFVEKRQVAVALTAAKNSNLVRSFLPSHIRDRVLATGLDYNEPDRSFHRIVQESAANSGGFPGDLGNDIEAASKPIADLHPHTTIMVADIVGFTAWSSVREPSQVFILLETVYAAFDKIAKRRKVFKVETIGDCYVAVAGLPDPRKDHAVVMARFAHTCMLTMRGTCHRLETLLGPDTAELAMRFGLHSGPVTAGVLRGERTRFQLFGATVNMATVIESSSMPNKIHLSEATAMLLNEAGKSAWVKLRPDLVKTKHNETLRTYWLVVKSEGNPDSGEERLAGEAAMPEQLVHATLDGKSERLIGWHVDVLSRLLKRIAASRNYHAKIGEFIEAPVDHDALHIPEKRGQTVLDEVKEIITLPNTRNDFRIDEADGIRLDPEVVVQLRGYVTTIAELYRPNSFHCFEHASHVAQSLMKFLSRVVTPDRIDYEGMKYVKKETDELHEFTYGLASDPLTHFACVFSALIHDVDHRGVPNTRLIKEEEEMAALYRNKSVAEQNSVDLAWELLLEPRYRHLRRAIYSNQDELIRFRQLLANSVMATDIVDKELGALRKKRWNKAFDNTGHKSQYEPRDIETNRKATIVIEHLIQAADVAHTMQHWHIYLKWNERFFRENYQAYLDGRSTKDPSETWYQGELGFFDFYIIPLAKKLESCGCFGNSSDECLDYAKANRAEWEERGKDIVKGYLAYFEC